MRRKSLFRQSLFLGLFLYCSLSQAGENLPDIEAHQFDSIPVQKSKTGRVYLFKTEGYLPRTGSVILVHDQDRPAMAFRVLRTDEAHSEYVAKKIRRYDKTGELEPNQKYFSIEKIADVVAPPAPDPQNSPQSSEAPAAPIPSSGPTTESLSTETPATAPAEAPPVDSPPAEQNSAPPPEQQNTPAQNNAQLGKDDHLKVEAFDEDLDKTVLTSDNEMEASPEEIDETVILSPFNHSVSLSVGLLKNLSNFVATGNSQNAFLASYSHVLGRDVFVLAKAPQDYVEIEGGAGYYSWLDTDGGSYTLMPLQAQMRYSLQFSQSFALSLYGGIQYNLLLSSELATQTTTDNNTGPQQTFGLGFLFNLGPHWFLKTDLGWDKMTIGLAIKW